MISSTQRLSGHRILTLYDGGEDHRDGACPSEMILRINESVLSPRLLSSDLVFALSGPLADSSNEPQITAFLAGGVIGPNSLR
jgi:hypothetical protein